MGLDSFLKEKIHLYLCKQKGADAKMNMDFQKKEDERGLVTPVEQEQLNQTVLDEKLPEFDVIGTALNDV